MAIIRAKENQSAKTKEEFLPYAPILSPKTRTRTRIRGKPLNYHYDTLRGEMEQGPGYDTLIRSTIQVDVVDVDVEVLTQVQYETRIKYDYKEVLMC